MSTKRFCDECGKEIVFGCDPMAASRKYGISPTVNTQSATKYAVHVSVRHHDTSNQPDLCGYCLNEIIRQMVRP